MKRRPGAVLCMAERCKDGKGLESYENRTRSSKMANQQVPAIPKTPSDENPENEEDVVRPGRRVWLNVGQGFSDMNGMPAYAGLEISVTKPKTQVASQQRAPQPKFSCGEVM